MRRMRLALPSSAGIMLASVLATACAPSASSVEEGLRVDPTVARPTAQERREERDSARAQYVADRVGPRVTIRADFDYAGGSRQVDASFHMYDDAYVIVGHLDAAGRLRIVFPSEPGDDGFVRGDKVYYVPTFFAGFSDEYAWRYSDYRYRFHSTASRYDSYDAGLGYVFIIASWRPMRLDRIANGNHWQTYEVDDISYMQDPREAIEELGSVIAGDNREAYTIEYAHYTTTNYGTYALSDFDAANGGCYGYRAFPSFFFSPFGLSPFGFQHNYFSSFGCPSYGSYYGPTYFGRPVVVGVLSGPPLRPAVPIGAPIFHRPQVAGVALHHPEPISTSPTAPIGTLTPVSGVSAYHRPGLIAVDVAGRRGPERTHDFGTQIRGSDRPNIQQMVGGRRLDDGPRAVTPDVRDNPGWSTREPTWTSRGGGAYRNQGGRSVEAPRGSNRGAPSYSSPRSQPSARAVPSHSAPPRAAPAARPSPPSSSSSGSKKP